jgi:predicted nucleic acid-binding protein
VTGEAVVLDASVGVKWFRNEPGGDAARALLERHAAGESRIVVPVHFLHELLNVARREGGEDLACRVWSELERSRLAVVALDAVLVRATLDQCRLLGCTFYDALAAGLAAMLDAPLYSADARAHAAFPGVRLIGG